ncbi:MAG: HK97 family phage prohead protease [Clostridium sp.]
MNKNNESHFTAQDFELRSVGDGENKKEAIQGYALTFDQLSEDMGFREIIRKGALDNTDFSDVVFNFNHSESMPLSRNNKSDGAGSLKLSVDDIGLFFEAIPTDTSYSRDLIENVRNGVLNKCSFRFSIDYSDKDSQSWDWDIDNKRGYDLRTINKIKKIRDVSIVTYPAYEGTSATTYKRAKDDMVLEKDKEKEREKLMLEISL